MKAQWNTRKAKDDFYKHGITDDGYGNVNQTNVAQAHNDIDNDNNSGTRHDRWLNIVYIN